MITLTSEEPQQLRSQALNRLMAAVDAEVGLFYRAVRHDGVATLCDGLVEGSPQLSRLMQRYVSHGPPVGAACDDSSAAVRARRGGWTLAAPPDTARQRFQRLFSDFQNPEAFSALAVYAQLYAPLQVVDQLRLLSYQDGAFVGWIGVMRRRGAPAFTTQDERIANASVKSTQQVLGAAAALANLGGAGPLHAVFNAAGDLECANPEFGRWLNRDRVDLLGGLARDLDRGGQGRAQLDGVGICWSRLASNGGARYLAVVTESQMIRRAAPRVLTAVELDVARAAVAGAKVRDIAAAREVSANTVKFHLRNVYYKLCVSSRVGLARALERLDR